MKFSLLSGTSAGVAALVMTTLCVGAAAQEAPAKEAQVTAEPTPPRAAPTDYQAHAALGKYTIAAELTGHQVPTPESIFSTEEYIAVEVAMFGPPGSRQMLSFENFSLRINGKKGALPAQPYTFVFKSLKDPDWSPPDSKSKGGGSGITSGGGSGAGGQGDSSSPPPVVHMPLEIERAMTLRVQKAAFPDGDHPLPKAGLIFFQHRGKTESLHSIELIYNGPAGQATLALEP